MGGKTKAKTKKNAKKTIKKKVEKDKKTVDNSKLILSHKLVPKMHILTDVEYKKMLSKYKVTKENLPKLYTTDPEAESLKAKEGDVIEITRDDGVEKYKTYRVVVSN